MRPCAVGPRDADCQIRYRSACIIGSGAGGLVTFETAYRDLFIHNKRATHPLTLLRIIGSSAAAHVGIEFGVKGPTFATCSRLLDGDPRHRHRPRLHSEWPRRCRHRRRLRKRHQLRHHESLAGSARALARRLLPVLQEAQRHRAGRGRRHSRDGKPGARPGARRHDPCGTRRLRHGLRQSGHGQADSRGSLRRHAECAR